MKKITKEKLQRRLHSLREVLEDCSDKDPRNWELVALYHVLRDVQPMLCEAIAEQTALPSWRYQYTNTILSDEEQIQEGTFLWEEEIEDDGS